MTSSPDPLGKRALFWAPAERDEDGPRSHAEADVPGKYALFSAEARAGAGAGTGTGTPGAPAGGAAGLLAGGLGRLLGGVTVDCSSCGARLEVSVAEFAVLHLPLWLWRPGRGYTRFMTCPACRRRTWVSASWGSGHR